MTVSIRCSFEENEKNIYLLLHNTRHEGSVRRFYSRNFIRVHDTKKGLIFTADLFEDISYFGELKPKEEWNEDGLRITFTKSTHSFWGRMEIDVRSTSKEIVRDRRALSIKEAEAYYDSQQQMATAARGDARRRNEEFIFKRYECGVSEAEALHERARADAIQSITRPKNDDVHQDICPASNNTNKWEWPVRPAGIRVMVDLTSRLEMNLPARSRSGIESNMHEH